MTKVELLIHTQCHLLVKDEDLSIIYLWLYAVR